jgi:broad specificity phosphatase PhoE
MDGAFTKNHRSLKRKPFLTPIWLAAIAAAIVVSFASWLWSTANSTTVIVIRHAEKASNGGDDPPLDPAGAARALLLARMFGDAHPPGSLDAIYVSPALRNRQTAAPLAARLGISPVVVPADDPRALARRALHEHDGGRILIIGHSDTVPEIVAALSGQATIPAIGDSEYGTMYVVTVPRLGRSIVLRLTY